MHRSRQSLLAFALAVTLLAIADVAPTQANEPGADRSKETAELLKIIETDGLTAAKAAAFENLAVVGGSDAIPVLAPLLADQSLAHYARYALEPNPDPAVDRVFRQALKNLQGDLLIGVINSMAVRRDAGSLSALEGMLADKSPEVVAAAAAAIGSIATPEAVALLTKGLADAAEAARPGFARGCLICAENLGKAGQLESAVALYDLVRAAKVPKNIQLAGLRGAILARRTAGIPLLVEQLASSDREVVNVALRTARELDDPAVPKAIIATVGGLSEASTALVLLALGDFSDPSVATILAKVAASGTPRLRLAAIKSLGKAGDGSAVAALWKGALGSDPRIAAAAVAALVAIPGEDIDAAIVAGLNSDDAAKRELTLELIARRRIPAAVPQLLKLAEGSDKSLRLLAIQALGETAPQKYFSTLIRWVIAAQEGSEKATTAKALQAACTRLPDRDACASALTGSLAAASGAAETTLLEQLGAMGGPEALQCLADCAKDSSPETQDAATRILGTWVGSDVGPVLLELARSIQNKKYKIRVLRGYIRIASQFGLPHDEKMEMCRQALAVAERDNERELVLKVLERNPSPISLGLAVGLLDNARLKNQAASVALSIAERLLEEEPKPVAEAMQVVVNSGVEHNFEKRAKTYLERALANSH